MQKPPWKTQFSEGFLHNLRYNFEVRFQGHLECTPSRRHQKLSTTSAHALSAPPPSCCAIRRPIALCCVLRPTPLVVASAARSPCHCQPSPPLPRAFTPPSHCVVCCPPAFLFDCCVLDWRRLDVVADLMSCIVRPFPLAVLSAARLLPIL